MKKERLCHLCPEAAISRCSECRKFICGNHLATGKDFDGDRCIDICDGPHKKRSLRKKVSA